jgi:hypothetical protein
MAEDTSSAEVALLDLADFIYAHTSLKPMSKTLFLVSRCLLVSKLGPTVADAEGLCKVYHDIKASLGDAAIDDDYSFPSVVAELGSHLRFVLDRVRLVRRCTEGSDSLGLAFNTLLRGKFEGGEGLGTFLTPEEVVEPMVDMALAVVDQSLVKGTEKNGEHHLYGDICGGTGRFVYSLARRLRGMGVDPKALESTARLFDQSAMAVDLARLNFIFDGMTPSFACVDDSLIASQVSALKGRFALLATNPPFGAGKYRWHAALREGLSRSILTEIGMNGPEDSEDPSELFFFRNLDLLAPGGVLAIVLPDGVLQSGGFRKALDVYETSSAAYLNLAAIVSLPAVTFSLGGTVAKTSFVVVRKDAKEHCGGLYVAAAHHVGFLKRGNRRGIDEAGNDLVRIAREFRDQVPAEGRNVGCWREHDSLCVPELMHSREDTGDSGKLSALGEHVSVVREYADTPEGDGCYHVSVLDVDETGLINVIAASRNRPTTKGVRCRAGEILVSCLNPKIWRVAVIPSLPGIWSCSAEFVVLRPKQPAEALAIALALHDRGVMRAVQALAGGTSSSRQRVPKHRVLDVKIPSYQGANETLAKHAAMRADFYRMRLREARVYDALHGGNGVNVADLGEGVTSPACIDR